jgi:hypothetical protein
MLSHKQVTSLEKNPIIRLLLLIAAIIGAIATIVGVAAWIYSKNFDKYEVETAEIKQLSAGVQIDKFIDVLGIETFKDEYGVAEGAPILSEIDGAITEYIFNKPNYYVQALVDNNEVVLIYSVTTKNINFSPTFELGPYSYLIEKPLKIQLGKTTFEQVSEYDNWSPETITANWGAQDYYYSEAYYLANPGNYQSAFFTNNQSGYNPTEPNVAVLPNDDKTLNIFDEELRSFRKETVINTYSESMPMLFVKKANYDYSGLRLGPDYYKVRVLK